MICFDFIDKAQKDGVKNIDIDSYEFIDKKIFDETERTEKDLYSITIHERKDIVPRMILGGILKVLLKSKKIKFPFEQ